MDERDFLGRVAVVTGASGRLGRLVTAAFQEEGAQVAALVRTEADARLVPVVPGSTVRTVACDVTDAASVQKAFARVAEEFGRVDALAHTVGGWARTPLLETPAGEWERILRINLLSTWHCFREAARIMAAADGGGLVAIASSQGADRGIAGQSAYAAAKAGVIRLVESAAEELASHGITARAVAPSTILYGGETSPGVPARTVVRLCLDCAHPDAVVPSGSVLRAYGTAADP